MPPTTSSVTPVMTCNTCGLNFSITTDGHVSCGCGTFKSDGRGNIIEHIPPAKPPRGRKDIDGKLPYDLLPFDVLDDVVAVQAYGAKKYAPNSWQWVPDGRKKYIAAALRHISRYQQGERINESDGNLYHLAQAICDLMYAHGIDKRQLRRHKPCATKTQ